MPQYHASPKATLMNNFPKGADSYTKTFSLYLHLPFFTIPVSNDKAERVKLSQDPNLPDCKSVPFNQIKF